jgi:hypothetical protein
VELPAPFKRFQGVFEKKNMEELPPSRSFDHGIDLDADFVPKVAKVYPLNPTEHEACRSFVDKHLATGKIQPSKSPQASPFFFVPKKDGTVRPCQDYRYVNSHIIKNAYPLPLISDLVDRLRGSRTFTKMDIRWGYNNVLIRPEDRWKAAFITPFGLFKPTVMFFGLCNSPATFQALMDHLFGDFIAEGWLIIYMDDLLIHSAGNEVHQERTEKVLQRLQDNHLYLKLEKCAFAVPEVEYLGMVIMEGHVAMDPTKLTAIDEWQPQNSVKGVRSFIGFCNFSRRFIPDFSNIACPLHDFTRKNTRWDWTPACEDAFLTIKDAFTRQLVLSMPDISTPFFVMSDASLSVTGAMLMQKDSNGDLHPCAYLSKTLSSAEWNYDIYDCELLAVIHALEEWRHYLLGTAHVVTVLTDHKNLTYFRQPHKLSRRQARWNLFLQDFDLHFSHTPRTQMGPADALSCRDNVDTADDNVELTLLPDDLFTRAIDVALADKIALSTPSDPLVLSVLQALDEGASLFPCARREDWLYQEGKLYFKGRLYVPEGARRDIVVTLHESAAGGHGGIFRTQDLVARDFWWPGLNAFVHRFVTGCAVCQAHKVNTHPSAPPLTPLASVATRLFQQVSVDLITDLPLSLGFDSVMVVVDHGLTKGVIISPCHKSVDAAGVAQLFFKHVFARFGLHDRCISDRGPQFASAFARELARLLKYDLALSSAYHPQTDGETERLNQELETYLRIFCDGHPEKWAELLPMAEYSHNSARHSSTGKSPFSLILGYEPRSYPPIGKTFLPALESRLSELEEARKEALAAQEKAQQTMRERISSKFHPWKVGDKVWLEGRNLRLRYPSKKLVPRREGPFEIAQVISPVTFQLRLPPTWKIHNVFHASLLMTYREMAEHGPNYSNPPSNLIGGEEEFELDQILSHRGT